MSARECWDRLYEKEGRPWKGSCDEELRMRGPVLELGIGNGKNLSALPKGAEVVGLDFSRSALMACAGLKRISLLQADVVALPFRDGSFPAIAASHILGHLEAASRLKAAGEMVRTLADGGLLYVSVFGEEDMRCGKGDEVEERTFARGNGIACHYFLENEVPCLFSELEAVRAWERRLEKRYDGKDMVRQERRFLLRK